jgi:hypothetical protein
MFDSENGRDTIRRNLLTRKTLARLVEIATQGGGAVAEKPAKAKKTAKKKAEAVGAIEAEAPESEAEATP